MALMELDQKGVPLDKMVIGKPVTADDVNNSGCVKSPRQLEATTGCR